MPDHTDSLGVVRFAAFQVDLRSGELWKHGIRLKLQEQPFRVLAMLLERPGAIVTRDELRARLWPSDTFVDFDHSLNSTMNKLREALSDSAENPRCIETIPRRGYRFLAQVETSRAADRGGSTLGGGLHAPASRMPESLSRKSWRGVLLASLSLAITVFSVLLAANFRGMRDRTFHTASGASRIRSLAVLPLENLSNDAGQEFFADGMTDQLTTDLSQIDELRVVSRTSAFQYKGVRKKPLPQIAKELGVDAVVEGSVLRSGGRVRITAELVDARTDQHLWAKDYERDLRDVLALQDEVAQAIAVEIKIKLTPREQARLAGTHRVDPEAYELYLRGRYYWNKRTEEDIRKAIAYFQGAIEKDPSYPLSYSGLADCYAPLEYFGFASPTQAHDESKRAATKALQLDDTLAEVHTSMAVVNQEEWDWRGAEREFVRAIELNPNYAIAHHWYANYLGDLGRADESLTESRKAQQLDPLSLHINEGWANRLYLARHYDLALKQLQKTLELDPAFPPAHWELGLVYEQERSYDQAIAEFKEGMQPSGARPAYLLASLAHAYALSGRRREAAKILDELQGLSKRTYVSPYLIALVYVGLGRQDEAMDFLGKAYQEHSSISFSVLRVEPRMDPLRSDPRFADLLRRMNLQP